MSGRGHSDSCVLRKRKRPARRRPDVVIYVDGGGYTERWALFDLTIEQREALRQADGVPPTERACEVARLMIGDLPTEDRVHGCDLPALIPKENIQKGWRPGMHPGGPSAPTVNYMIVTVDF